jgi:predicted Fe-Mo cluster-binding NifX family protein
MKICITARGDNLQAAVDPRFGRCRYFVFYDMETDELEAQENSGVLEAGGVGVLSAQNISAAGAETVLTGNVGPNAFQTLKAAGIAVITDVSGTVADAIQGYKDGKLKATQNPTVGSRFGMPS